MPREKYHSRASASPASPPSPPPLTEARREAAPGRSVPARAAVDDARESFARDGVVGREAALGNLYASINVEQERAARDEARREQERSEREQELLRRGKALVAEQRITADAERRAP